MASVWAFNKLFEIVDARCFDRGKPSILSCSGGFANRVRVAGIFIRVFILQMRGLQPAECCIIAVTWLTPDYVVTPWAWPPDRF